MQKRLTKSPDKILAGVFGGIANYFGFDPAWVRIIGAAVILFTGIFPGIALYIIAAMVLPEPGASSPKAEKHDTDYHTGRPNIWMMILPKQMMKKNQILKTMND
ncbi:hypothetical protein IMAU30002_01006 [Lactobacillus helveticus]|nr:hypothetical protein [Lactobacillus helveticus]